MTPDQEDQLLVDAIAFAMDMREDLAAAHRAAKQLPRDRLEQMLCTLGAMVNPETPLAEIAWWREAA